MFSQSHFMATGVSLLEYWRFHSSRGILAAGRRSNLDLGLGASSKDSSFSSSGSLALGFFSSLGFSSLGFFSLVSFLGGVNLAWVSQKVNSPATALKWGWLTMVVNQRVTAGNSLRKGASKTILKPPKRAAADEISAKVTRSPTR